MAGGWIGVISNELCDWGLEAPAADSFACEFVVNQPYDVATATVLLSKRLRDLGLEEPAAEEAATTLLAVSLFTTRRNLGDVGRILRAGGVESSTARGAAMDSSRIRREIRETAEEERAALVLVWRRLAPALGFTGIAALLFAVAGTIG